MSGLLGGKTVLITNISTPLGYSIAQRLGFAGANLFVSDTHDQKLRKAVHKLNEHGLNVAGAVVDVSNKDNRKKLFEEIENKFKVLDSVIVNNPVNSLRGNIADATKMELDDVYNKYLTVPFRTAQAAVPLLSKSTNGSIIFMTSFAAFSPFEDIGLYSAAQTALLGLCKAASQSLGKKKIRVNSVSLGMMKDDGSGGFWSDANDSQLAQLAQMIPLGRIPKSSECTALVEFLASDRAKYITGENCVVNGGVSVRFFSHRPPPIQAEEFSRRRNALLTVGESEFKSSSPVAAIVRGASRTQYAPDVYYPFKQCSYFRYLSGVVLPDSFLFFDKKKSVLFIKESSEYSALWDGCRYSESELEKISGVDQVLGLKEFEGFVSKNISDKGLILEADDFKDYPLIEVLMRRPQNRLKLLVDKLRWIKSPQEIELMKRTCAIGSESINSMIKKGKFIKNEAHIAGRLEYEYRRRETAGAAYPPVVAAGARANTIHYIDADQDINPGDCVLVDAGCDLDGYVSDISRNFPVSGRFTDVQRTLYEALEAVHGECLEYVNNQRPLKLNELYFKMLRSMARYFREAGVFDSGICEEEAYGVSLHVNISFYALKI
ncbi:hypothetical protein FO519_002712 [Halicephalobus sp. NKZ332]|nr:hypothetical protein FO519_002712 [Halicephalobus sp. NKZ332]